MNRIELIIATAIVLFIAFLMGWFTHWLIHRFVRVGDGEMSDLDTMAQQLHEAEEQRDQAVTYYQQRESEMTNQQTQTEAELNAAMEGLREARHEAEELRAYIERQNAE
jgi:Spy/CpxP family protein refolding chaperone